MMMTMINDEQCRRRTCFETTKSTYTCKTPLESGKIAGPFCYLGQVYKLFPFEGGAEFILLEFPCFFQRQKEREFVDKVSIYV